MEYLVALMFLVVFQVEYNLKRPVNIQNISSMNVNYYPLFLWYLSVHPSAVRYREQSTQTFSAESRVSDGVETDSYINAMTNINYRIRSMIHCSWRSLHVWHRAMASVCDTGHPYAMVYKTALAQF